MRCEALEEEVVKTRKELDKLQALYHQSLSSIKDSKELNNILSKQQSPLLKTCLDYEEGSSSSHSENKKSGKLIKIQSNKQSEYKHTLSTKENENETSIRIRDSNQKDKSIFSQDQSQHNMRQPIPCRQPRFMYQYFFAWLLLLLF